MASVTRACSIRWFATAALLASLVSGCAATRGAKPTHADVPYGPEVAEERSARLLDVYLPPGAGDEPVPAMVFVHGGSWRVLDKGAAHAEDPAWVLAQHGVAVVAINHRKRDARHPDHVDDVAMAIAWVHAHAEQYGIDSEAIFVGGMSSGGHLAALVGVDPRYLERAGAAPDVLAGVVAISGIYDLDARTRNGRPLGRNAISDPFGDDRSAYPEASPLHCIRDTAPPFLVISAKYDLRFMRAQAQDFRDALVERGVPVRYLEVPGNHLNIMGKIARQRDNVARLAILEFIAGSP